MIRSSFVIATLAAILTLALQEGGQAPVGSADKRTLPRILVYRVNDVTGRGHSHIPEILRDELARTLVQGGHYDVVPNREVPEPSALSPLGDAAPSAREANKHRAEWGITSQLLKVDYNRSESDFAVKIEIQVNIFDAVARELVGSPALGEGSGAGKRDKEGVLSAITQASRQAAAVALDRLMDYRTVDARIQSRPAASPGLLRLDRGRTMGLAPGRLVVILSGGKRTALAVITAAEGLKSEACILEIEGPVRVGDRARLVRTNITPPPIKGYLPPVSPAPSDMVDPTIILPDSARIGSTRGKLMQDFLTEGGLSSPSSRTFLLRDKATGGFLRVNGYITRITVDFEDVKPDTDGDPMGHLNEDPTDVITKIRGPYLSQHVNYGA